MSHPQLLVLPALLLLPAAAAAQTQKPQPPVDDGSALVAKVGAIEITSRDLLTKVDRMIPLNFFHGKVARDKFVEFEAQALAKLIEEALILQDARARKIPIGQAEARAEMRAAFKKAKPGAKEPTDAEVDALIGQYRANLDRRILLDKNERRFEATVPPITDAMIEEYFGKNHHQFMSPKQAHLRHILIKVQPVASNQEVDKAKATIDQARKDILAGTPFAEVAKKISQDEHAAKGGDLGWVAEGSFEVARVGEKAFALTPGELSEVFDTLYGFHLVQCVATRPPRQLTAEEVRPQLITMLKRRVKKEARAKWLTDLRQRFAVQTFPDNLPIANEQRNKAKKSAPPPTGHGKSAR